VSIESPSICVDGTAPGGTSVPGQRALVPIVPLAARDHAGVIVVAGEALVDLVVTGGAVVAAPGGAPYNVARGCARLGVPTALLAAVSTDGFGARLVEGLAGAGVDDRLLQRTDLPTTLAVAELDARGGATYRFYSAGTSAPSLAARPLPEGTAVLVVGGLGLVLDPMAAAVESVVHDAGDDVVVVADLNCRPAAVDDTAGYRARLDRILRRADVVKASDEDLAWLAPSAATPVAAAVALLAAGPPVVLVTAGGTATSIVTAAGVAAVPVAPVPVVDTIGAGDAFTAGFASWWRAGGRGRADVAGADGDALVRAVEAAHAVAAVVVGRRGADPPQRAELAAWA
jgi:fructokinase